MSEETQAQSSEPKVEKPAEQVKKPVQAKTKAGKLAVVMIRGLVGIKFDIKKTLEMLRLRKKNVCVVIDDTPSNRGMLIKAKDYITWGEIDDATYKSLLEKRGKKDPKDPKKMKPFFNLSPPRKGFERKGVKKPFSVGGALGNRKEKINDLIMRMI